MIYISGPMTGLPGLNFEAFNRAAEKLRAAATLALSEAEGLIHNDYDGTQSFDPMMAALEPVRAAIAKATGEQHG